MTMQRNYLVEEQGLLSKYFDKCKAAGHPPFHLEGLTINMCRDCYDDWAKARQGILAMLDLQAASVWAMSFE